MTATSIASLSEQVLEKIEWVSSGNPTQYLSFHDEQNDKVWKIRIANHGANPERADENTISFIVPEKEAEESDDDAYSPMHVNKKSFKNIPNQHYIENGCDENGTSVEELLTYHIE